MKNNWIKMVEFTLSQDNEDKFLRHKNKDFKSSPLSLEKDADLFAGLSGFLATFIPIYHLFRFNKLLSEVFALIKKEVWFHSSSGFSNKTIIPTINDFFIKWARVEKETSIVNFDFIGKNLYYRFKTQTIMRYVFGFLPIIGGIYGVFFSHLIVKDARKYMDKNL